MTRGLASLPLTERAPAFAGQGSLWLLSVASLFGGRFTPRRRQLAEVTRNKQRGSAPSGLNADKRMRVRWRQSWGDVFDLLLKDRDLLLLLIIAVLGALIGIAALFGVLIVCGGQRVRSSARAKWPARTH